MLVHEGNLLAVVESEFLNVCLLPLHHQLLDFRVNLVACHKQPRKRQRPHNKTHDDGRNKNAGSRQRINHLPTKCRRCSNYPVSTFLMLKCGNVRTAANTQECQNNGCGNQKRQKKRVPSGSFVCPATLSRAEQQTAHTAVYDTSIGR